MIARNSTFHYKGKPVDVRHVGRELGARYVLEGSVRRVGKRVRISAQLIDATSSAHRWAERYDRTLGDMLGLQAELARGIVSVLGAHVAKAEVERTLAKPPSSWQAYDCYLRATALAGSYQSSASRDQLHEARRLLLKALELDRDYARAHAALALGYLSSWVHRWDDDCPWQAALDRAFDYARDGVRLAPNLPEAYMALGFVLAFRRRHDAAVAAFERTIALNPNFTNWRFPFALILVGEPVRAIDALKAHMSVEAVVPAVGTPFVRRRFAVNSDDVNEAKRLVQQKLGSLHCAVQVRLRLEPRALADLNMGTDSIKELPR